MNSNFNKKRRAFSLEEKMQILKQVDCNTGTRVQLAASLGLPVTSLNTIVKQRDDIEKNFYRCGSSSSKKRKSMKSSPLEELESVLATWFKQARTANVAIDGNTLKEKALQIAAQLGIDNFRASNGWIDRFKNRHNLVYKTLCGESGSVNEKTVSEWKSELKGMIEGYKMKDIFNADETGLFYNLQPNKTLTYKGDVCHGGTKSKQRVTVLLCCNADGSEKLPPLVIGKFKKPRCLKNIKKLPTKYTANSNSWMTLNIFEDFLIQLDRQMGAKNRKIVLFVDQCAAHPKNVDTLRNIKIIFLPPNCTSHLQPLDLGIIHSFKFNYRKQLMRKAVAMIDGGLLGDASTLKINLLVALNFISVAWNSISPMTIQNCFRKCGFLAHGGDNIDVPNVLDEEEVKDWNAVRPADIDFAEYVSCDANVSVCEIQTIDNIVKECVKLNCGARENEEEEEESDDEIPEKVSFLQALQGLETVRKFVQQSDVEDNVLSMLSNLENKLYFLKRQEKTKQKSILDWVNK